MNLQTIGSKDGILFFALSLHFRSSRSFVVLTGSRAGAGQ